MTVRDFIRLVSLVGDHKELDKELLFSFEVGGREVILTVDGIDEASDDNFVGVNLTIQEER